MAQFDAFLGRDEVALISCCNVGHSGSRYSVAVLTRNGIDWLDLDSVMDPARDKGITGITRTDDHCFLAVPGDNERLISLDSQLRPVDVFECTLARDLHSLSIHQGRLYFASTGTNQVLSVGCVDGKFSGPERVDAACLTPDEDLVHLNSVLIDDQTPLLYSMFGVRPRTQLRDTGSVVDASTGQEVVGGLMDPHSISRLPDGRLAVCESMQSAFCIIDPDTRELTRVNLRGYTRGIAHMGRHLLVGASHWRNRSRSTSERRGLPSFLTSQRHSHSKESHLFVLREDLSLVQSIDFTPYAAEIYDVAFLGRQFHPAAVFGQAIERRQQSQRTGWVRGLIQPSRA